MNNIKSYLTVVKIPKPIYQHENLVYFGHIVDDTIELFSVIAKEYKSNIRKMC